jgi:hypothetical protein
MGGPSCASPATPRSVSATSREARHHRTPGLRHRQPVADAGFVIKEKDGRRNRYQIQDHLPVPEELVQDPAIGDVLVLLTSEKKASL